MFGQENIYPPVYKVVLVRERHGPSYVVHGAKAAAKVFATFFVEWIRPGGLRGRPSRHQTQAHWSQPGISGIAQSNGHPGS